MTLIRSQARSSARSQGAGGVRVTGGDTVEHVAGVLIELQHWEFQSRCRSDNLLCGQGSLSQRELLRGHSVQRSVFQMQRDHLLTEPTQQCRDVLPSDAGPVGVQLEDDGGVKDVRQHLEGRAAIDDGRQFPGMVVVRDPHAVTGRDAGRGREHVGDPLDILLGLPEFCGRERMDHRANAQLGCGLEDRLQIAAIERLVRGRGSEPVLGQAGRQVLRVGEQLEWFDPGQPDLGQPAECPGEVSGQRFPHRIQLHREVW